MGAFALAHSFPTLAGMASLMAGFAKSLVANSSSSLSTALSLDRKSALNVAHLVRATTVKHWRKAAVVGAVGAVVYGALKVHNDLVEWRDRMDLLTREDEVNRLASLHSTNHVSSDVVCLTLESVGVTQETDFITEIEDVLEISPPEPDFMQSKPEIEKDDSDEKMTREVLKSRRKERKRIRQGGYGVALKSLVNKAKLAFPVPKQTELQVQAINLYLHKECRKLNLRVSDAARLIPQAVALAMVPSDDQILAAQMSGLASIQKRHLQRQWRDEKPSLSTRVVNSILGYVRK